MTRTYRSELRAEQVEITRTRIVEAAWSLLRTTRPVDLSYADVAREAAVSKRTVYRHFPTPDALFLAVSDRVFGDLVDEATYDNLEAAARAVHRQFALMESDPAVFRAFFAVPSRSRNDGNAVIERLFAPLLGHLPAAQRRLAHGLIDLLVSPYAWDVLHANWGCDADEAYRAVLVGLRAVVDHLVAHPDSLDPASALPELEAP